MCERPYLTNGLFNCKSWLCQQMEIQLHILKLTSFKQTVQIHFNFITQNISNEYSACWGLQERGKQKLTVREERQDLFEKLFSWLSSPPPTAWKISHSDNKSMKSLMICKVYCICGLNFIPSLRLWLRSYTKYRCKAFLWIFIGKQENVLSDLGRNADLHL